MLQGDSPLRPPSAFHLDANFTVKMERYPVDNGRVGAFTGANGEAWSDGRTAGGGESAGVRWDSYTFLSFRFFPPSALSFQEVFRSLETM